MIDLIETALNAKLAALGAAITGEIAWEGRAYSPKPGTAYTTSKLMAQRQPLGAGPVTAHLWSGRFLLTAVQPAIDGKPAATLRALAVMRAWPRASVLIQGAARVVIESADMQPSFTSGDWITTPVSVPFFCEEPAP